MLNNLSQQQTGNQRLSFEFSLDVSSYWNINISGSNTDVLMK